MFDFLKGPVPPGSISNYAQQQARFMTSEQATVERLTAMLHDIQKVVDAMCKVYVAEHAKDIADRAYADKFYQTDQPIVDRAKRLDLERQIMVAEMELKELKRKVGV